MRQDIRLRLLSYGVIAYMMLAFAWWSILLFIKNRDAFLAKRDLLHLGMAAEGLIRSNDDFLRHPDYLDLFHRYRAQEWMILGEAAVFMVSLVIGIWLINRGYYREMWAAQQRRNFLLSITHELKSPIASIRLVLETFQRRQLSPEQTGKLTGNALRETERLHTLVNDLLLSARLETAYQPYLEPIDLVELINDLLERLKDQHPEASFIFEHPEHFPPVTCDKPGISSVILNLLENAVKYSPPPARIKLSIRQQRQRAFLEVADQGIGIEDKEKKRIFEKFYRIGSEDTRKTKGTGLGLYIVDQIVRAHQGTIQVRDNEPKGTVFHIELPVDQHPSFGKPE